MFCFEGTEAISHMSVRNRPEVFNEPCMFAAISVKGLENETKVLESQVPLWKHFGQPGSGNGSSGATYGLPRFENSEFNVRFPFAGIELQDDDIPLEVYMKGWSPFIPTDADNSSLPVGSLEYSLKNTGNSKIEVLFSYHTKNFMRQSGGRASVKSVAGGFILSEAGTSENPEKQGDSPGASLYVPFTLKPGKTRTIRLMMAWYVPNTNMKYGQVSNIRLPHT